MLLLCVLRKRKTNIYIIYLRRTKRKTQPCFSTNLATRRSKVRAEAAAVKEEESKKNSSAAMQTPSTRQKSAAIQHSEAATRVLRRILLKTRNGSCQRMIKNLEKKLIGGSTICKVLC